MRNWAVLIPVDCGEYSIDIVWVSFGSIVWTPPPLTISKASVSSFKIRLAVISRGIGGCPGFEIVMSSVLDWPTVTFPKFKLSSLTLMWGGNPVPWRST